jgi:Mg2+-importing ATPase
MASLENFWSQDPKEVLKLLDSSLEGFSSSQAKKRYLSTLSKKKRQSSFQKDLRLLIRQFQSPLVMLLLGAVILSAFIGERSDVFIILVILILAGLMSFFQERNAGRVVEKLQSLMALKSTVLREGANVDIPNEQVVPGDILILNAGDMIPADCLLLESNELHVNEASLTGESFPLRKEAGKVPANSVLAARNNSLWEGTHVVSGTAKAVVVWAGTDTQFGKIVQGAGRVVETSFEKGIREFGYFLMKITLVLSVFILIVNLLVEKSILDSALFALALAVGMAPELLPAITTIAMSSGAKRLMEKQVIVKKLSAIQSLGEVNLLCTDKTGTITEGLIRVDRIVNGSDHSDDFVRNLAYWNAFFQTGYTNPVDEALVSLQPPSSPKPEKFGEIPYDFIRKRLSIAIALEGEKMLITKGAYTQISEICTGIKTEDGKVEDIKLWKRRLDQTFESFGKNGLRAIAICFKHLNDGQINREDEKDMIFAGFVLLQDPIKEGIIEAIQELKDLKVALKIISGDNKNVAKSIGRQIGIASPKVLTGRELAHISPEALLQKVKEVDIFAEIEPQQKERIIRALKSQHTVAYMGDGINDVSAINAADTGISVDNAVDVTKEAADIVLIEKDLSVLAYGIREGRKTFANTLKYIYISTGCTFGNMFSVAFVSMVLPFLPMLPKQILLTNVISDVPYLSITSDNVDDSQIQTPGKWDISVIRKYMVIFGIHSSFFDGLTFLVLWFVLKADQATFHTGWFIESIMSELLILFIIRTHKKFYQSRPGKYLLIFALLSFAFTLALPYLPMASSLGLVPLDSLTLGLMLSIVALYILTGDFLKVWFFKKLVKN